MNHKARATAKIPPRAAPTTTPMDTLSELALVDVGIEGKIELVLAEIKNLESNISILLYFSCSNYVNI